MTPFKGALLRYEPLSTALPWAFEQCIHGKFGALFCDNIIETAFDSPLGNYSPFRMYRVNKHCLILFGY